VALAAPRAQAARTSDRSLRDRLGLGCVLSETNTSYAPFASRLRPLVAEICAYIQDSDVADFTPGHTVRR
jgi:hypothetical protein